MVPGRIEVIAGCMFAGKTQHLIARLRDAQQSGRTTMAFKHRFDNRYDELQLVTHRREMFPARTVTNAKELLNDAAGFQTIGLDEGQFFGPTLVEVVTELSQRGSDVIIAGIDHNVWGLPFHPMPELVAIADSVTKLTAPCGACGAPARFSQRLAPLDDDNMVGGADKYEPRCEHCFEPLPIDTLHLDPTVTGQHPSA